MNADQITPLLEEWLEADFSFRKVGATAKSIAALPPEEQEFILDWTKRVASSNPEIAWQFARRAPALIGGMDRRLMQAWVLGACDVYDRQGLRHALTVMEEADHFAGRQLEMTAGVLFEDVAGVLGNFLHGLSGRSLALRQGQEAYTDTETIFLPKVLARFPARADNFKLAKAMAALLWAQIRFGTLRDDLAMACARFPDPERALHQLHGLETLRLTARIQRELPGLHRDMLHLGKQLGEGLPPGWSPLAQRLTQADAGLRDSLALLTQALRLPDFRPWCYQGSLRMEAVRATRKGREEKEKARLRVKLAELLQEHGHRADGSGRAIRTRPHQFGARAHDEAGRLDLELTLDELPLTPPEDVKALLTSVWLDFGEIPPEYLVPAGEGEYDPSQLVEQTADPDSVWQGTYHEEGATFYPEWDMGREHYRKDWCVMREKEVPPAEDGFHRLTLEKYAGLIKHLRRGFEAMRDEDRVEKRQAQGDDVDIDALVEALADARDGREMSDRLFTRLHRAERNIAVAFMVDMSGSTKGWINEAEREALILLCEALELLRDRYAIYGFSGITRKRCELFRIKTFDEPYSDLVKARICGIQPQEYTRMGFAIRHLTRLLGDVEARTRVLVTLSDGRPDDYFDGYRGPYGIEDTRMALVEARRAGIHPFCITIDREARDYLPHMYGAARYIILDDVRQLPMKVSDIYRRLTT
ncbi:MAG TPA: nitric oxide reductase activation protein [Thiobacillaceae bacterium]|nr:nitric oxide reductase activation protein [Thiobacillaceae bacterium]HNU63982.1 nitric oxide reductase activation protein [Thiobacillaceae bacterium]